VKTPISCKPTIKKYQNSDLLVSKDTVKEKCGKTWDLADKYLTILHHMHDKCPNLKLTECKVMKAMLDPAST